MSHRPLLNSASVAGLAAGVLAAGFAAWQFHPAPAAATAATAATAIPAALSREQAAQKLMALPELRQWADAIEQRSGGRLHGALLEYDPQPRAVAGQDYYQLSFVENGDDAAQALVSFLVSRQRGDILVEDPVSGTLLTLEQWRRELPARQDMERG